MFVWLPLSGWWESSVCVVTPEWMMREQCLCGYPWVDDERAASVWLPLSGWWESSICVVTPEWMMREQHLCGYPWVDDERAASVVASEWMIGQHHTDQRLWLPNWILIREQYLCGSPGVDARVCHVLVLLPHHGLLLFVVNRHVRQVHVVLAPWSHWNATQQVLELTYFQPWYTSG